MPYFECWLGLRSSGKGIGTRSRSQIDRERKKWIHDRERVSKRSNRGGLTEEERERQSFQILENGSNFPLLIFGEDGRLTLDKRATLLEQRERRLGRSSAEEGEEALAEKSEETAYPRDEDYVRDEDNMSRDSVGDVG